MEESQGNTDVSLFGQKSNSVGFGTRVSGIIRSLMLLLSLLSRQVLVSIGQC